MKTFLPTSKFFVLALISTLVIFPSLASAAGILGGSIIVKESGNVSVTFEGSSASYTSTLYLQGYGELFSTNTSGGTTIDVGSYEAGQELTFYILVQDTGKTFYTGLGDLNEDGMAHAFVENLENGTRVGFEDIYGGGDRDYNDVNFTFSNTNTLVGENPTVANPEPTTIVLFGSGLLGLSLWRIRKKSE